MLRGSSSSPGSAATSAPTWPPDWPPTPGSNGSSGSTPADPGPEFADLLDRVERIRVDLGSLGGLLADLDVDAVVHLALVTAPDPQHGGRSAMKEQNVIGTMQLLAACQRAPRLRKLVVRSSTAAYGASFRDPAVFTEETEPREVPRGGFARDILDIEGYVRGFRRRRPDVTATVLRFAPFIGSDRRHHADPVLLPAGRADRASAATRGCSSSTSTTRWRCCTGRSWRTTRAPTTSPARGCSSLSQAIRRAGRVAVPVLEPGLSGAAALARSLGFGRYGLDQVDLFVHGRVVDTSRLEREYGFTPRSTAEAFDDFIRRPPRRGGGHAGSSSPPPSSSCWTASGRSAAADRRERP